MADRKFSAFTTETTLLGTDNFVGYRDGVDNIKASLDAIAAYIGGGGSGTVTEVSGTPNQIDVADGTTTPIISIADNPIFNGIATAGSYTAQGDAPIPGAGTISVTNGNPIILGDGTSFLTTLGPNSGIVIDGVAYTVSVVYSDGTAQLATNYAGATASGLNYFYDISFLNLVNAAGTTVFTVNNRGGMSWPNLVSSSLYPAIFTESYGGASSGLKIQADILTNVIDSLSSFNINNSSGTQLLNISGATGDAVFSGDLTLGNEKPLYLPVSTYNTYLPTLSTSIVDGLSQLSIDADLIVCHFDGGGIFSLKGASGTAMQVTSDGLMTLKTGLNLNIDLPSEINLTDDGAGNSIIRLNDSAAAIGYTPSRNAVYTSKGLRVNDSGAANQFAFSVYDTALGDSALFTDTLNHNFGVIGTDYIVYSAPSAYEEMFHVVAKFGDENLGRVSTRFNVLDDGAGNASFLSGGDIQLTRDSLSNTLLSMNGTETMSFYETALFNGISADWDVLSFQQTENTRFKGYVFFGETSASSFNIMTGFRGALATENAVTFDIPSSGEFYFWDNLSALGIITSEAGLAAVGASSNLLLENSDDIPPTPSNGIRIFSQYDVGLGHSLGFYIDSDGNVTQIGEGSGGGGTVTDVDVTSDLTVDGTPGGAFSVAGTIGLAVTGVTAGFNDFAAVDVDENGRITDIEQRGSFSAADNLLILNGTGVSEKVTLTAGTMVGSGADASNSSIANFLAMGTGAKAGNQGVSVGAGAGNATSGHNEHLFLGYGADATANSLINIAAIGPNSRVSANNTYAYGDAQTPASHGFNTPQALSSLHVVSKTTSGSSGSKGVLRLNGINDAVNTWPVTDKVIQQNALITTGVSAETILLIPISNGLDGCITRARIQVSGIINNGSASGAGEISVVGAFDGGSTFYLNAVSSTTPIPITLEPGTTAPFGLPAGTASAQVVLSGTTGGIQNILVQVIGVNATTINWVAWCEYYTTQAVATV